MDQPLNSRWIVWGDGVTYIGAPQSEGNDWNGYNYMATNPSYSIGTSTVEQGNYHQEEQAVVTQGTPAHPSPLSDAEVYQHSDGLECRWLRQDGWSPCGQKFSDRMNVVKHLNHVHGVNGSASRDITCRWLPYYTSVVCGQRLKRCSVSRHVNVHFGQALPCPYPGCGKTYSRRDSLKKHMKKHGDGNFNA